MKADNINFLAETVKINEIIILILRLRQMSEKCHITHYNEEQNAGPIKETKLPLLH